MAILGIAGRRAAASLAVGRPSDWWHAGPLTAAARTLPLGPLVPLLPHRSQRAAGATGVAAE